MGFWDWLTRRKKADVDLMQTLLQAEAHRQETAQKRDALESQLALRKLELEIENVERLSEEKRKDAAEREKLRIQRREWARTAREKKAARAANGSFLGQPNGPSGLAGCRVCAAPTDATLTADEIRWHAGGHPGAITQ